MAMIETNVPFPGMRPTIIYPWYDMAVGNSFLFRATTQGGSAYSMAWKKSKLLAPKKFLARKTRDGYRCWRVK